MIPYALTTATFGIGIVLVILILIRKNSIYVRYSFWWISVCTGVLTFSLFPRLSDIMARSLGISYPPTFLFFIAILMIFVKILSMDIDRSKQELRIRRLIQRLAILEAELEKERKK